MVDLKVKNSIYIDTELLSYIKKIADLNCRSVNQMIIMILNEYKKNDENQEDN